MSKGKYLVLVGLDGEKHMFGSRKEASIRFLARSGAYIHNVLGRDEHIFFSKKGEPFCIQGDAKGEEALPTTQPIVIGEKHKDKPQYKKERVCAMCGNTYICNRFTKKELCEDCRKAQVKRQRKKKSSLDTALREHKAYCDEHGYISYGEWQKLRFIEQQRAERQKAETKRTKEGE